MSRNIPSINTTVDDFIAQTADDVWKNRYHWHHVDFKDGNKPKRINGHDAIINYMVWQMYKPFGAKPSRKNVFRRERFTGKRFVNLVDTSIDEIDDALNQLHGVNHDKIWDVYDVAYQALSDTYNFYVARIPEFVGTLSGYDILYLSRSKKLKAVLDTMPEDPTPEQISEAYSAATNAIKSDKEIQDNNIYRWILCDIYDHKIFDQGLVARGYCADVNSDVIPFPVTGNYFNGINYLHEMMAESRLGGMSVLYQKSPLETTEYGNRRNQMCCSVIEGVDHKHDCGNRPRVPVMITDKKVLAKYSGREACFAESPDKLFTITEKRLDLIGKEVLNRSIGDCRHPDPQKICGGCFGLLHKQQPPGCNLGHQIVSIIFEVISQLVLSIKHVMASSNFSVYQPVGTASEFLKTREMKIKLNKGDFNKVSYIKINAKDATNIPAINRVSDIKVNFNPAQVGSFSSAVIGCNVTNDDVGNADQFEIPVANRDSASHLTIEFVEYMKEFGWEIADNGNSYLIRLDNWDYNKPVFSIPMRHRSMLEYFRYLNQVLETEHKHSNRVNRERGKDLIETVANSESFTEAVNVLDSALGEGNLSQVHISNIETIIRASTVRGDDDTRPANNGNPKMRSVRKLLASRSYPLAMSYQSAHKNLLFAKSYLEYKVPRSYFDNFIG